ncbi:hypothetical protein C7954_1861 [Halanaerobium congolense]|uniref:Protein kinase domain-containing protein n=1 Tax=Halanaerobium congolense TaxID=54121 RepID=A0A4R8G2D3_9FIRM|nr:hypothetical protein [Halanaerobium congolense]TDX34536.1 hypothetical protein C7954_1861 [Halanaerobium congolense]
MLSEAILRYIAEVFIGDQEDYYQYKSGNVLVDFFNNEFGFNDKYDSGFPSRWYYTSEKIKALIESDDINDFLTKILSTKFIQIENRVTEVEAVELSEQIVNDFNRELKLEDHKINKLDSKYILVEINSDLKYIGEGGFAVVYKQISTGIIIKKLKEEFLTNRGIRSRFKREFKITKSLSNVEGVIDIYDFNNDEFSYTMEEADITLYDYIVNNDIDNEEKVDIINKILNIIKDAFVKRKMYHPTNRIVYHLV